MNYRIGIFGHRSGDFRMDKEVLRSQINNALDILKFQYGKELLLNVDGEIGVGQMVIDSARALGIKYHIFLPCPLELFGIDWFDEQRQKLDVQYKMSCGSTIISNKYNEKSVLGRDSKIIEDSKFVICFWEEKLQGRTFDMIKNSLKCNRLILNGLKELKMISNKDIKKWKKK